MGIFKLSSWAREMGAVLWTGASLTSLITMQVTLETKWEYRLIKFICSFNQVLLVYCCLRSLLGFASDCMAGRVDVELLEYEDADWEEEVPVTARAAHLAALLPAIALAVLASFGLLQLKAALASKKNMFQY